jgi:hypothetical protein
MHMSFRDRILNVVPSAGIVAVTVILVVTLVYVLRLYQG